MCAVYFEGKMGPGVREADRAKKLLARSQIAVRASSITCKNVSTKDASI